MIAGGKNHLDYRLEKVSVQDSQQHYGYCCAKRFPIAINVTRYQYSTSAPVIDPNQPLITAPSEATTSRESEKKVPLALRPKQSAPPATISKHAVSQKAEIFSQIERVASPKNTTMPSIRLIFICVFGGLLKV